MDKKYLDEREKSIGSKLWKVRSKELAQSYKDALFEFAAVVESSRTDNSLALLHAHVSRINQSFDHSLALLHAHVSGINQSFDQSLDINFSPEEDKTTAIDDSNNSNNQDFSAKDSGLSTPREGLWEKLAKEEGYDFAKKHEATGKKAWRVYNKLKTAVLAFSSEVEHDQNLKDKQNLRLRWQIEQRLRSGDQVYREHVETLLASQEVDQKTKAYFLSQHNKHKTYILQKSKENRRQIWSVYNKLTQSVFTLADKPEEHAALQQDIEKKMEDENYRSKVDTLLASREINDQLAEEFVEIHKKHEERKTYQANLKRKKVELNARVMSVYKLLEESVFGGSDNLKGQSMLQWEIERRLAGTDPVDRFYQRKVAELLAAGKVAEKKGYVADVQEEEVLEPESPNKGKTPVSSLPSDNDEFELREFSTRTSHEASSSSKPIQSGDQTDESKKGSGEMDEVQEEALEPESPKRGKTLVSSLSSDQDEIGREVPPTRTSHEASSYLRPAESGDQTDESKKGSGKINKELKWYFTNVHSKYPERYTFMKMEEDERSKSFKKRLFGQIHDRYRREEIKEKIQQTQLYSGSWES